MSAAAIATSRACPICGSTERRLLHAHRFAGVEGGSLLSGYDVVVCRACGLGYADGLPPQEAFDAYYREMSKYENPERDGALSDFDRRRYEITAGLIRRHVETSARVLDVGCATGGLLSHLAALGYRDLVGLEPSPVCADVARRLYGLTVHPGTLADLPAEAGSFDLVILGAVLEHVRDLHAIVDSVQRRLAPRGRVYVEVPDAAHFTCAGIDSPFQEFSIEHVNYLSRTSLRRLLGAHGFAEEYGGAHSMEQRPGSRVYEVKALYREGQVGGSAERDEETEAGLSAYIAASREVDRAILRGIRRLVDRRAPFLVWGVGTLTQRLVAQGAFEGADIRAFVDSNPRYQGKRMAGRPIVSPAELAGRPEPILVSSLISQDDIERQIREKLRLPNEVVHLVDR